MTCKAAVGGNFVVGGVLRFRASLLSVRPYQFLTTGSSKVPYPDIQPVLMVSSSAREPAPGGGKLD